MVRCGGAQQELREQGRGDPVVAVQAAAVVEDGAVQRQLLRRESLVDGLAGAGEAGGLPGGERRLPGEPSAMSLSL